MITLDFITALFFEIDEQLGAIPKHPEARLCHIALTTTLEHLSLYGSG